MARMIAAVGLLLAGALGGCQMLNSEWLPTALDESGRTCHSNAGTYQLPRRLITVAISGSKQTGYGISVKTDDDYVADSNETYCLDFLLSYLSADRIGIQRTKNGLLQRVYTKTEDRSPEIAKSVIRAAADLIASERASLARTGVQLTIAGLGNGVIASFTFDPFVEREAREANEALRPFGFCLFIDTSNDPFAPAWSPDICKQIVDPRAKISRQSVFKDDPYPRSGLAILDSRPVSKEMQERGILYRPELSHSLIILRKKDPGSRYSKWLFASSERIVMPNAAPAFILEIKRAMFVTAETDVRFNQGLIKSVSVNKPSELLVVADVTVAAAQIIVQIPARTLQIFNNRAENTKALIATNSELIDLLRQQNADAQADALARQGLTPVAPQLGLTPQTFNPAFNPAAARLTECLSDPAARQNGDPLVYCQSIVGRNQ